MTLALSERDVESLLDMKEVVIAVEEAFRRKGKGEVDNSPRNRSRSPGSVLNAMHATLPYLGRGGLKAYVASRGGLKFVVLLFDLKSAEPLAVMGADALGRFRTGAASGVATKHLYRRPSAALAVFGTGRQALTQVLGVGATIKVDTVRVWSPNAEHRVSFAETLQGSGIRAVPASSVRDAVEGADVACTITKSREPFLDRKSIAGLSLVNACGVNDPGRAELSPDAVGSFDSVVVDDLRQGKVEYGDLILAEKRGEFSWDGAVELGKVVAGEVKPEGRALFKSGGAALEDVALASLLYDKAVSSEKAFGTEIELV